MGLFPRLRTPGGVLVPVAALRFFSELAIKAMVNTNGFSGAVGRDDIFQIF